MKHLSYLNKYFYKYRWRFLSGTLFVALSNVFAVLSPQVVRYAIDMVVDNTKVFVSFSNLDLEKDILALFFFSLLLFCGIYLLLAIIRGLFMFFMRQTLIVMSRLIEFDLKNELYEHYQILSQSFYKRNNTGDLMSRVAEDVSRIRMYVGPVIMYSINLVVLFILVIGTMLRVNSLLTFYVLIPLPILAFSIYHVNSIIHRKSENIQKQLSFLTTLSQEMFSGMRVVKAYVQEKNMGTYFETECEEYKKASLGLARVEAMFHPLMLLLIGLSTIITIYVGGLQVIRGSITAGNVAEFVIYVNLLTWPVASLGWVASLTQRAAASQKRINEFLKTKPDIISLSNDPFQINGDISFRKVSFTYPDTGIEALKSVSFDIKAGEKIALIGRTGAGKSTLAELITRLYDVQEGEILIDGKRISDINLQVLRKSIAYVPQDVFLFSETIAYNILFGKDEQSLGDAERYAGYASIHKEIERFPEGYQTMVGERGVTLSGGQKQRISIARAFSKEASILLLDDCLSAVDANTEREILQHMKNYLKDRTALIITHRIFSLFEFDNIIVLNEGRIAEQGEHEDLLKNKGLYWEMYEKQKMEEKYLN